MKKLALLSVAFILLGGTVPVSSSRMIKPRTITSSLSASADSLFTAAQQLEQSSSQLRQAYER